jgi:hypothetical protein
MAYLAMNDPKPWVADYLDFVSHSLSFWWANFFLPPKENTLAQILLLWHHDFKIYPFIYWE